RLSADRLPRQFTTEARRSTEMPRTTYGLHVPPCLRGEAAFPPSMRWARNKDVDGRVKPGHDGVGGGAGHCALARSIAATMSAGDTGACDNRTLKGASASSRAEMTAGMTGSTPHSPTPLTPSGLR